MGATGSEALCRCCCGIQVTEWVGNKRGLFQKYLKVFKELREKKSVLNIRIIIEFTVYACRHQPPKAEEVGFEDSGVPRLKIIFPPSGPEAECETQLAGE